MPSKKKRSRKQKDKKRTKSTVEKFSEEKKQSEKQVYQLLPPQDEFQDIIRRCFGSMYAETINQPHCRVCGETEEDSRLLHIQAINGKIVLCQDCYDIQMAM